jgi:dephospho-CoA kinase
VKKKTDLMKSRLGGKNRVYILGLTGGIGSGKSTVLNMFKKKGAETLDADAEVHAALKSRDVLKKIKREFGSAVFRGASLDRRALAEIIFSSLRRRRQLESIIHPIVRRKFSETLSRLRGRIAVCDVPLLFENKWERRFNGVAVVSAPLSIRLRRLAKRGIGPTEARKRMRAQLPVSIKNKKADFLIRNGGSIQTTKSQVNDIWDLLMRGTHGLAARK